MKKNKQKKHVLTRLNFDLITFDQFIVSLNKSFNLNKIEYK